MKTIIIVLLAGLLWAGSVQANDSVIQTARAYYESNVAAGRTGHNWLRVLIAFGAETHETLTPFTAAEARERVSRWSGWEPFAVALEALEAQQIPPADTPYPTAAPTNTPMPTSTPIPTATPVPPTATPKPTNTPIPPTPSPWPTSETILQPAQAEPLQAAPLQAPPPLPTPQKSADPTWVDGTNCFWWNPTGNSSVWKVRSFATFQEWRASDEINPSWMTPNDGYYVAGDTSHGTIEFRLEVQGVTKRHLIANIASMPYGIAAYMDAYGLRPSNGQASYATDNLACGDASLYFTPVGNIIPEHITR